VNAAHLHLMVNHLPLFAALFAGALLAAGLLRRHKALSDAGLVLAVVAGMGAFAAAQTGERAEGIVENLPGVTEAAIENHEEAAEAAMFTAIALGVLALAALALPARMAGAKRAATLGSLAVALVAFALVGRAANLGGMIRHTEISDGASVLLDGHAEADEGADVER
jgi:uncharacterized membrane protein